MQAVRAIWRFLSHPGLSAAGNVSFLFTYGPFVVAVLTAVAGRVLDQPALFLVALGVALLGMAIAVVNFLQQRSKEQSSTPSGDQAALSRGDIQQEQSVPGGRIYDSSAIQQAIFENARREDRAAVEDEFVTMIEEGKKLCEEEFTGEQSWLPYYQWRQELLEFISTVLGGAERQRFIEVEVAGPKPRDHVTAVMGWLRERRDHPESWTLNVEGEELAAAIKKRRGAGETPGASGDQALAAQLDALMREGMELLDELMAPAQAEETGEGVWALDFGDAPAEWWDKADAFYKKTRDLLAAKHPALLPDFERGYNERLRIQRERETVAPRQPDSRSTARKMLDFATETQRTPAKIVEACLEGLSQARKSI